MPVADQLRPGNTSSVFNELVRVIYSKTVRLQTATETFRYTRVYEVTISSLTLLNPAGTPATLRAFFRDAVAEKVIKKNPFDQLPKKWWPKTVTPEPDPFTERKGTESLNTSSRSIGKNGRR